MVPCGKLNISGWFHVENVENDRQSYAKYYLFFIPEG